MTTLHFAFCIFHFALAMVVEPPVAVPVSGEPFSAELAGVGANGRLTFQVGPEPYAMPAAELVCWGACPEQGRAGGLVLTDGGWLAANTVAGDEKSLTADSEEFGALKIPLNVLAGVLFRSSSNPAERDKRFDTISPLPQAPTEGWSGEGQGTKNSPLPLGEGQGARAVSPSDRLLLDNGDELSGRFLALADGVMQFQTDLGPIDVKTNRVTALIFGRAENHQPGESTDAFRAWTGFRDGSRLLAAQLATDGDILHITTAGQPLTVSQNALIFLQPLGGRAVYLSDLEPAEYRQTPYLDLPWPYRADRNVAGGFLRCGGRLYLKGLGVHGAARLVYDLSPLPQAGKGPEIKNSPLPTNLRSAPGEGQGVRAASAPQRFQAELAIDESTAGRGSVRFRVLVDGRERYVSPTIRGGQPPTPVTVDIHGAKKLELLVDYADRADVLDRADWLNARLIR